MGYRRTSRNTWVPKRQDSDEDEGVDVAEAEDEPEGEEIDAEAMEFDVDADLADDPPIIPSLPEFPTLPLPLILDSLLSRRGCLLCMRHRTSSFKIVTSMQEEQRQFFAEMRTFMARFPPP
ncbi:hypothetical protein CJ030_MR4G001647 [Morella rubra]|uniref:Uncharacterized protein n=1 Tax=Morella rubra TaxID=262757 RepID=A0A6A1VUJ8_9ROSI|nr:hypothetical protein CJ030_MR4G001647 [Morella rubra]